MPAKTKTFRDLLRERGISQRDLARKADIAESTIYTWAAGIRKPTWAYAKIVAPWLGMSTKDFFLFFRE